MILLLGVSLMPGIVRADKTGKTDPSKPAELKPQGTVSGLMTDFKNDYMLVQLDDQPEPIKFMFGPGISIPVLTKHGIFPCNRISFKYKTDGGNKVILDADKLPGRQSGVAIGKVIKVYNDFWVSVKPNDGMIEGFALGANADQNKAILKSLNPGDLVAIKYSTDFERHRIVQMEVKPAAK